MGEAVVRSTSARNPDLHYFGPAGRTMQSSRRLLGFAAIEKSPVNCARLASFVRILSKRQC